MTKYIFCFFHQVDNNVTRHLDSTLKRDDWDILILHYLGLDHIGHISGPHSSLIQPKLLEMDDILKKIHGSLVSKVFSFSIKLKVLLMNLIEFVEFLLASFHLGFLFKTVYFNGRQMPCLYLSYLSCLCGILAYLSTLVSAYFIICAE